MRITEEKLHNAISSVLVHAQAFDICPYGKTQRETLDNYLRWQGRVDAAEKIAAAALPELLDDVIHTGEMLERGKGHYMKLYDLDELENYYENY